MERKGTELISFCIPFRSEELYRCMAFEFVSNWIAHCGIARGAEVLIGDPPGEFTRSGARNKAAAQATGDVLIFLDADSIPSFKGLRDAVSIALSNGWCFPYDEYVSLTKEATLRWYTERDEITFMPETDFEFIFPGPDPNDRPASVGACVVVTREAFEAAGKWDERFVGWSFEDRAFATALGAVAGPLTRIPGERIYHLWHPAPETERFGQPFMEYNRALWQEYLQYEHDSFAMKQYIANRNAT
jgi:GT2 family glycosyltransferase